MVSTFDDDDESPWDEEPTRAVPPESPKWFTLTEADEQEGPFTVSDLHSRLADGRLAAETYVWNAGLTDWAPARDLPLWAELTAPAPQAPPQKSGRPSGLLAPPTFTPESQLFDDSRTAADPSFHPPESEPSEPLFTGVPDLSPERTAVHGLSEAPALSESEHPTGPQPPPAEAPPGPLGPMPAALPRSPDSLASFLFADLSHAGSREPPTEIHMPDTNYGSTSNPPRPRNEGVISAIRTPGELEAVGRTHSGETPAPHSAPRWIWALVVAALAVIVFLVTRALR